MLWVLLLTGGIMEKLIFGAPPPKPAPVLYAGPFPRKKHSHRCEKCGEASYCYQTGCKLPQRLEICRWCRPVK